MHADDNDEKLYEGSPRGEDGLATGSAPQEGLGEPPDPGVTVKNTARGGEGLAEDAAPGSTAAPDPDETVKDTARGGEGLANDA